MKKKKVYYRLVISILQAEEVTQQLDSLQLSGPAQVSSSTLALSKPLDKVSIARKSSWFLILH